MTIRKFELATIRPETSAVLGRLGYNPKKAALDDNILDQVQKEIEYSQGLIHPVAHTSEDSIVERDEKSFKTASGLYFISEKLSKVLQNSSNITMVVCTIGQKIKDESDALIALGEMTRGVILDAISSEAVESFADYINEVLIREKKLLRLQPTMRFSPGYGDLKTDIHPKLLSILKSDEIGVMCNLENYILFPEKTITAVIGWHR